MTEKPEIYAAMSAVLASIRPVGKEGQNRDQGYSFRKIDDVMGTVHSALAEYNVFFTPHVLKVKREQRATRKGDPLHTVHVHVRYTFYASDGSVVLAEGLGEGTDTADKATNKAMTGALKYMLTQTFCIPFPDQADADKEAEDSGWQRSKRRQQPQDDQWQSSDPEWMAETGAMLKEALQASPSEKRNCDAVNMLWVKINTAVREGQCTRADGKAMKDAILAWGRPAGAPETPETPETPVAEAATAGAEQ